MPQSDWPMYLQNIVHTTQTGMILISKYWLCWSLKKSWDDVFYVHGVGKTKGENHMARYDTTPMMLD